ncbi:hypothetical protein H6P81_021366 [Aristolochia fimbriata]|uniref:Uncharacterized protein n=1 Tax=Aristolochia fimbriata TaxID=158543 RepID=A0AAV7DT68_ARIFI|nr:hypothetical protein H6P81_021366 [Aristolochia fimbriata]
MRLGARGFAFNRPAYSYSSRPGCCPDGGLVAQLGTVTRLSVHPASPVLLTKNGPLGALDSVARLSEAAAQSYLFKNFAPGSSYPEGKLRGNQLLDGSISLSPLYPSQASDLRRYRCGPPPEVSSGFAPLRHSSPSFGSRQVCSHSNPSQKIWVGRPVQPARGSRQSAFLAPYGFGRPLTSHTCQTPWSVFQGGSNGKPAGPAPRSAQVPEERVRVVAAPPSSVHRGGVSRAGSSAGLGSPVTSVGRRPSRRRTGSRRPHLDRAHRPAPSASLPTISSTL